MIIELAVMLAITFALGVSLAIASKRFAVREDPKAEEVFEALPHANCGACGFPGCMAFAKAVVDDTSQVGHCRVGGPRMVERLEGILGIAVKVEEGFVARVKCKGSKNCKDRFEYRGIPTCKAASQIAAGPKSCPNSCMGFGDCVDACPFHALGMGSDTLPEVDQKQCNGCGLCVQSCPKAVLVLTHSSQATIVRCSSTRGPKDNARDCATGCIACGTCVKSCPVAAIRIESNLAVVDYEKCTHCGVCAKVCPRHTIEMESLNNPVP
jgi:Na+-translocating ferredoxin:NAD+ oxidoreductase RNF subunit RnfB